MINEMRSMPAEQFGRSIDPPEGSGDGGGGAAVSVTITPPMWLEAVDTENVKVKSATVNGLVPSGIAANIDVSGTDGTWYIFLDATLADSGIPSSVAVSSNTTGVTTPDTSTHAYLQIGRVTVASSVITAVTPTLAWSQTFVACGRDTADPTTTPGTYYWVVS